MAIGLREAREQAGISQAMLARLAGTADSVVREIEAARKPITLQMAQRLGEVLGVDGVQLWARHSLDEWRADLSTLPERYDSIGAIQIGLFKTRHMMGMSGELRGADMPDEMQVEIAELTLLTADELARLSDATRDAVQMRYTGGRRSRS